MQVLFLGRAPRTKETLPDFLKWRRVTRHPLVFRGLTGSQRTPRVLGGRFHFSHQEIPHLPGIILLPQRSACCRILICRICRSFSSSQLI